jgi:murein DD-endopeptidase MepM/ murein hydrolase activator NlpD
MKLFSAVCLFLLLFSVRTIAEDVAGVEDIPEETKLREIQEKLEASKLKLKETKEEEQQVLGRLAEISKELKKTKSNLYYAQRQMKETQSQIGSLTFELSQSEGDLVAKEAKLGQRLREVYKSSGLDFVELLVFSSSMSDFLNRAYFFRTIIDYDANLVQTVREDLRRAKRKRYMLQVKHKEISDLADDISKQKEEIVAQAEEKEKAYSSLKQRREEYEAQIAEMEKSSKDLEVMILKKMAESHGGKVLGTGALAWPLEGRITSKFGYRRHPFWGGRHFHTGLDISGKYGAPVVAADAGEVIFSGWWDGYGKAIVIDHGRMTTTVYGHLSRMYKNVGAVVAKGQVIGLVGNTGYSTGPHLHFEVRKNGKPVDPLLNL